MTELMQKNLKKLLSKVAVNFEKIDETEDRIIDVRVKNGLTKNCGNGLEISNNCSCDTDYSCENDYGLGFFDEG